MLEKKFMSLLENFSQIVEVEKSRGSDKKFHQLHTKNIISDKGYGYDKGDFVPKDKSREADLKKGEDKKKYQKIQKNNKLEFTPFVDNEAEKMRHYYEEEKPKKDGYLTRDEDPCWKGYRMYGFKMKNGKKVPNCVKED